MGTAALAHAVEPIACSDAAEEQHFAEEAQPLGGSGSTEPEKGSLHLHGGCHGHHVAQPLPDAGEPAEFRRAELPYDNYASQLTPIEEQQGLRPPIA
jgi:hypothetical protein